MKNRYISVYFKSFLIPWEHVENLGPLLDALDSVLDEFNVMDYSVEMTSLEEVFLRLGDEAEEANVYEMDPTTGAVVQSVVAAEVQPLAAVGDGNIAINPSAAQPQQQQEEPAQADELQLRVFEPLKQIYAIFVMRFRLL